MHPAITNPNPNVVKPNVVNPNVVNPNKVLWEKGDFTEIAAFMRESGEAVVESLGITPRMRVLDLGCGDGTTALPSAAYGSGRRGNRHRPQSRGSRQ